MAWDSLEDLWWLKPQQSSDHSRAISHGFSVGAQMAQNSFENKMAVQKMAMDVEAQTIQNAIYEQSAQRSRAEFLMDSASFEALSGYQNVLNLTPTDREPPLPPAGLAPRFAAQAHTALSDWKGQSNYIMRQKAALEAMETVSKHENALLDGATKLLQQGGRNVIQMGPKGPMVDPNELSSASEEFKTKQFDMATARQVSLAETKASIGYSYGLLGDARKIITQGGRNVINIGPDGPVIDPGELSMAAKELYETQLKSKTTAAITQREAIEAITSASKYQMGLLSDARAIILKGGNSVIKQGPDGPSVSPEDLSKAAEALHSNQLSTATMAIPTIPGMSADIIRYRLGNGSFVTLRRNAPGMTKEQFAAKNLPELMKQTQDVPSAAQALEALWQEYQKFTGTSASAPVSIPAGAATGTNGFRFENGVMVPINVPK